MSLTRFAVRYRPVTWVVAVFIMLVGVLAIFTLSRREDPDLQGRFVQIIATYPGATAGQVEELLTDKIERTLLELDDIKTVRSTSRPGMSVLQAECGDQVRDVKKFRDELRDRIYDLRPSLPAGVATVDVDDRFADTAALILAVTDDTASDRQRESAARRVRDRLRTLSDIAEVNLLAVQQERILVTLSSQRLSQLAITPAQIAATIGGKNILPASGGSAPSGDIRLSVQPSGNLKSQIDLDGIIVGSAEGAPVYLRDVARVERGYADPPDFMMRVDGKPAVGISLTMRKGRNIQALGENVRVQLAELQGELPPSMKITIVNDLPRSVRGRLAEFNENLITGVALIVFVLYLFMGIRSAFIVGAMLPITILGTFALMYFFGRDIQQISITALIIALGLVVDNSIVVVDNIDRKLSEGIEPEEAAIQGVDEVRIPLLTSNLTTVASFAPLMLLSGGVGEFIRDLGIVTSLATLISLLFNYTIAPLIAIRFLHGDLRDRPNRVRRYFLMLTDKLRSRISGLAERGLRMPAATVGLATISLVAAIMIIPRLGLQFFPSAVRSQFTVDINLPQGRDILATRRVVERVESIIKRCGGKEIESIAAYIGQGGPRFYYNVSPEPPASYYAQIVVNTREADSTRAIIARVQTEALRTISEARVTALSLEQGPPVGAPIAVRLSGESIADLRQAGEQIKAILNQTRGASSVFQDFGEAPLTLKVDVNEDQARLAGLSSADISQATAMGFSGATVSNLREGDTEIPIQMRLEPSERSGPQQLNDLYLPNALGESVPLRQVASLSLTPQEAHIVRRNHVRTLTVSAYSDGSRLASQILEDAKRRIERLNLTSGVSVGYGGEQEEVGKSFSEMLIILWITVAANLLIVVWEFNSFRTASAILVAVPFSMVGAILGLYVMHLPFGFMAFLGITALAGVVTNHAIVLFEYARAEQSASPGISIDQALITAGRKRLRPILLTVLLSIFGVLPQALNGGTLWPPLAWSLIAGLLMSLVLTLVVVPSFYKLISRNRVNSTV